LQTEDILPWVFGTELGAEASKSLGKHLTVDFTLRMKAAGTTHIQGHYPYRMLGASIGTGLSWKF
jgi:hypothetical protein